MDEQVSAGASAQQGEINGAQSLLTTLLNCGVEACFANPGTSELNLVAALQSEERMRPVLCLFEGVATGAADGYGRMKETPAATLLHLGSGFANGWANLHNARKAKTPLINLVGQHATWHIPLGSTSVSDLEGVAGSISDWVKVSDKVGNVGADVAESYKVAMAKGGQIASLILPADATWETGAVAAQPLPPEKLNQISDADVENAAKILKSGRRVGVLVAGPCLRGTGIQACTQISAATGATFYSQALYARMDRGAGRMPFGRIPAWGDMAKGIMDQLDDLIIVGDNEPVLAFGHPTFPSKSIPDRIQVTQLATEEDDVSAAILALAGAVGAAAPADVEKLISDRTVCDLATGDLTGEAIAQAINRFLPEGAIISDESGTAGGPVYPLLAGAAPHDSLFLTGGAIGQGLPVGLGAAIACPDRKVVCLEADGSGMYTLQALWSMAREKCDVTTVIFSNRVYGILIRSLGMYDIQGIPNRVPELFDLGNPDLNWAKMAEGMGVEGHVCETAEDFNRVFEDCMGRKGPQLIEAVI